MGFGAEVLFFVVLGAVVLGPQRMHTMLEHIARAKAHLGETTQALKSQLAELDDMHPERPKSSPELSEDD